MLSKPDYRVYFGDSRHLEHIEDEEIHLVVTSPPYFNAPFDYPDLFKDYENDYLGLLKDIASALVKKVAKGRIVAIVTDDMLVDHIKYPIVADTIKIFLKAGFKYRERITWVKPIGYTRISRRSGVLLQNPYPMYYYPDNIQESIIIFQNGEFDYNYRKTLPPEIVEKSKIDINKFNRENWYVNVWNITNVLPMKGRVEEGIAAFPEEIPRRLIKLFTYVGETVLDPFIGSGTTMKVAMELGRKCIGYEIDIELKPIIEKKLGIIQTRFNKTIDVSFIILDSAKHLRTKLNEKVRLQKSVTRTE